MVLMFLPPYSPDFNSIKEPLPVIGAWLKKHHVLARTMWFIEFSQSVVDVYSQPWSAKAHFKHAGYIVGRARHSIDEFK